MERVLALELSEAALCYAVLEGSERLIDWGVSRDPERGALAARINRYVGRTQPSLLVAAGYEAPARAPSARRLATAVAELPVETIAASRTLVQAEFALSGTTRPQIARAIARQFPELAPWLPDERPWWRDTSERIGIFSAVAAGLAVLRERESSRAA